MRKAREEGRAAALSAPKARSLGYQTTVGEGKAGASSGIGVEVESLCDGFSNAKGFGVVMSEIGETRLHL